MSVEVLALGGGILFMLVAIVGGGFVIREIAMPRVPHWARVASGVVGLLLLLPFMLALLRGGESGDATPSANSSPQLPSPERTEGGIEVDAKPAISGDRIELRGLAAAARTNPPQVGDTVTVSYSLTNVGEEDIQIGFTFVGGRNPADDRRDSEEMNQGRMLKPGETVQAEGRILLDGAGPWTLWPCYTLSHDRYCPDKWKAFSVMAE
jgi:hypothetical protein